MIRVVLDTNVVVSSLLSTGFPKAIIDLALQRVFSWYVSQPILEEYEKVLAYPRLKIDRADAKRTMGAIHSIALTVRPQNGLAEASQDDDNRFLECAQANKAHYLVRVTSVLSQESGSIRKSFSRRSS